MRGVKRGIVWGTLVLLIVAATGWGLLLASLPQTAGSLGVPALRQPVIVARDSHGIPSISAETDHDAYAALGFVHAQDRFFQMEMLRRLGRGRVAEVLGPKALRTDKYMRTLGLLGLAEDSWRNVDEETRAVLRAYADGVNGWLETQRILPPELLLLGIEPAPWTPVDSLLWGRVMALRLSDNWREEALRAAMLDSLPAALVEDLWSPADAQTQRAEVEGLGAALTALARAWPEEIGPTSASNQWVLGGARTARGTPIVANDPHLALRAPNMWYLAEIVTPRWRVSGATVPGIPFHVVGQNGDIAWGFTTTHSDTADLFIETLIGTDRYATPEGPRPLTVRTEKIAVRNGEAVPLTVRETRHGPVVSDLLPVFPPPGQVLALRATALARDDRTPMALHRLNRATSVPEALAALEDWHAPQQNVVLADRDNRIAFRTLGRTPVRKAGRGTLPRPGAEGKFDWIGWVPPQSMPAREADGSGLFVNANERPAGTNYPHFLAAHWPPAFRARRILERLDGMAGATLEAVEQVQLDAVSMIARDTVPLLLAAVAPRDPLARTARSLLDAWDHRLDRSRPEPLIFNGWLLETQKRVFQDEMGGLLYWEWGGRLNIEALTKVLRGKAAHDWCDDVKTPASETCAEQMKEAFHAVVGDLAATYGDDPTVWRWGDAHKARFAHTLLRHVPVLNDLTGFPIATDGGLETINRGTYAGYSPGASWADRLEHVHGPGLRAVMDVAAPHRSGFAIAMGQSGHLLSPHYNDLLRPWRDGAYVRFGQPAAATLTLLPPGN